MDRCPLLNVGHGHTVNGLAHNVPDAAEGLRTYGHLHRCTSVLYGQTTYQAVGRRHGNGANQVTREVHLNLENDIDVAHGGSSFHGQSVVDRRHMIRSELNVDNRANDTDNVSDGTLRGRRSSIGFFSHLVLQSCGATDDLVDLGRNSALTYTVVDTVEGLNHVIGVVRRILHCIATSSLLSCC